MATTMTPGGIYLTDSAVGEKVDVSPDLMEAGAHNIPFLRTIGFAAPQKAKSLHHGWPDMAFKPIRTTLNGAISSVSTAITVDDAKLVNGMQVSIDGEVMTLSNMRGSGKTFDVTRSDGSIAAASHLDGAEVILVSRPTIQGADAGEGDITYEPGLTYNDCQRFQRVVEVADEADEMELEGRIVRPYDDKAARLMKEMVLEIQSAFLMSPAAVTADPSANVAGQVKGLVEFIIGAGHSTDRGGASMIASALRDAFDGIVDYFDPEMGFNAVLLHSTGQGHVFDAWQEAKVQVTAGDPFEAIYGTHVRRLRVGPAMVDCIAMNDMKVHKTAVLFLPPYVRPATYGRLANQHEMLARTGPKKKGMISGVHTLEVHAEGKCGWVFYGLDA